MVLTRAVPRRRPNINLEARRQAAAIKEMRRQVAVDAKEMRRRVRASNVKIKFLLPQFKDIEVKKGGILLRKMKVRRVAKHLAKKRNVRYG